MSYDSTIHEKTLRRFAIRKRDFVEFPSLRNPQQFDATIEKAIRVGENGFSEVVVSDAAINGKPVYKVTSFEHELVLRLVRKSIARLTKVRQSNRVSVIRCLKSILEEGVDYRVHKFDISSFFETVSVDQILLALKNDHGFSRQIYSLLNSFFEEMSKLGISGLPRGMAISATLAEYYLRSFDRAIHANADVFFYTRYVDDSILITSCRETKASISHFVSKQLPDGLQLNQNKCRVLTMDEDPKSNNTVSSTFDFLGYKFSIFGRSKKKSGKPSRRIVTLDIAGSKICKIKTRIVRSALQFIKDGDFRDFLDRAKLLSGNYTVFDHRLEIRRNAGVFFNYGLIDESCSTSLTELDSFLRKFILGNKGPICSALKAKLTNSQRRQLLALSFQRGFRNLIFYNFSGPRLVKLMGCWKYE